MNCCITNECCNNRLFIPVCSIFALICTLITYLCQCNKIKMKIMCLPIFCRNIAWAQSPAEKKYRSAWRLVFKHPVYPVFCSVDNFLCLKQEIWCVSLQAAQTSSKLAITAQTGLTTPHKYIYKQDKQHHNKCRHLSLLVLLLELLPVGSVATTPEKSPMHNHLWVEGWTERWIELNCRLRPHGLNRLGCN